MKIPNRLTEKEQLQIFKRMKENPNDSWKPIPLKAPRYTTGIKSDWSWKKKSER